jgi:RNA polymerase sigma factor (sigma-70 family)
MTAQSHRMTPQTPTSAAVSDAGRAVLVTLLMEVARQDQKAFKRLYALTSAKLNGLILGVLRNHALAEEVLQDTYVNVWKQAGSYDPGLSSPMTWLAVIARNRAIDRLRSERSRTQRLDPLDGVDVDDGAAQVLDRMIFGQDAAQLHACVRSLDADQQLAIRAAFFDGLTYDELARREALPLSTIKSRIRRGLIKLRACMDGT